MVSAMLIPRKTLQIRRRGVTLLELAIAIAIVGVLAVLLFSVGRGAVDKANTAGCANAIRQFGVALFLYRSEHNGFMPPGYLIPPATAETPDPQQGVDIKKNLLDGGYLSEMPFCPASKLTQKGLDYIRTKKLTKAQHFGMKGSYALNIYLTQTRNTGMPGPYWPLNRPYPGDQRMLMLGESYFSGITWADSHITNALTGFDTGQIFIQPRHHGPHQLHFMFLDGHVKRLGPRVTEHDDGTKTFDWSNHFGSFGKDGTFADIEMAREY